MESKSFLPHVGALLAALLIASSNAISTNPATGSKFEVIPASVKWTTAVSTCTGLGGSLAVPSGLSDSNFVSSLCSGIASVAASTDPYFGCWLGASRSFVNGECLSAPVNGNWVKPAFQSRPFLSAATSAPLTYTNWLAGRPAQCAYTVGIQILPDFSGSWFDNTIYNIIRPAVCYLGSGGSSVPPSPPPISSPPPSPPPSSCGPCVGTAVCCPTGVCTPTCAACTSALQARVTQAQANLLIAQTQTAAAQVIYNNASTVYLQLLQVFLDAVDAQAAAQQAYFDAAANLVVATNNVNAAYIAYNASVDVYTAATIQYQIDYNAWQNAIAAGASPQVIFDLETKKNQSAAAQAAALADVNAKWAAVQTANANLAIAQINLDAKKAAYDAAQAAVLAAANALGPTEAALQVAAANLQAAQANEAAKAAALAEAQATLAAWTCPP